MIKIQHITTLGNFQKILNEGCIKSRNNLCVGEYCDTANKEIVNERGDLNNYVPFHIDLFERKWGISYNRRVQIDNSEESYIYLLTTVNKNNFKCCNWLGYVFHPLSHHTPYTVPEDFLEALKKETYKRIDNNWWIDLKWDSVQSLLMSEVLVENSYSLNNIEKVYVRDEKTKTIVSIALNGKGFNIPVEVTTGNKYFY